MSIKRIVQFYEAKPKRHTRRNSAMNRLPDSFNEALSISKRYNAGKKFRDTFK